MNAVEIVFSGTLVCWLYSQLVKYCQLKDLAEHRLGPDKKFKKRNIGGVKQ